MPGDLRVDAYSARQADFARPILDWCRASVHPAFPPSARRDYCGRIGEAKRAEMRDKRIAEEIIWLRQGKRRHRLYETG